MWWIFLGFQKQTTVWRINNPNKENEKDNVNRRKKRKMVANKAMSLFIQRDDTKTLEYECVR